MAAELSTTVAVGDANHDGLHNEERDAINDLRNQVAALQVALNGKLNALKPMIGATTGSGYTGDEAAFTALNTQLGAVPVRRTYDGALPASYAASKMASDAAAGRRSLWSVKSTAATFPTDTAAKNAFSAFLDTIPADAYVTIHVWHEPEASIAANALDSTKGFTLAQWGALQTTVGTLIRAKSRPRLQFGPCFQGPWTFDTRSGYAGYDWASVADTSLWDLVGLDPYRTLTTTPSLEKVLTVGNSGSSTTQTSALAKITSTWNKPVLLSELGCFTKTGTNPATNQPYPTITIPDKIAWTQAAYTWMKAWNVLHPATPILGASWFNYTLIGSDQPMTGDQLAAYAALVADCKS